MSQLSKLNCEGKKHYLSEKVAERARKYLSRRVDEKLTVYHCDVCKHYHVGGQFL